MKLVSKIIWGILFFFIFLVALKNMDRDATLAFFAGHELTGPLPLVLLVFTVAGFVLGVLAMTPTFFRYRRELGRQRKTIRNMEKESEAQQLARSQPPPPDTVVGA